MSNARRGRVFKDETRGTWGYIVDVAEPGQPRKQQHKRGFKRQGDAQDALNKVARRAADGLHVDRSKVTLGAFLDEYIATQAKNGHLRATTADSYRRLLDWHVRPALGGVRLQSLRGSDLDKLYASLLVEGRQRASATRGAGLSPSTIRQVHAMVSGALTYAEKQGLVVANVARNATPPKPSTPETPTWTVEQTRAFLAHPAVVEHPDVAVWRVAAATGMRRGELCGLGWADVDLDAGAIDVRHNATAVAGEVSIGAPKTDRSRRKVTIGPATVAVLREHLAAQHEHRLLMGAGWTDEGLVFPTVDGRVRRPVSLSKSWAALVARTGLPRTTLHALRHAHGTLLLESGVPVHVAAARLGHDAATLLRVYAHALEGAQDHAASLEGLLDGERAPLRVVTATSRDHSVTTEHPGESAEVL